ncbi:hypothetical protein JHK82_050531 [Glycine max]|nr:hypothetical protein JHK85_051240 [Glycine max]KAG5091753.1 hypothetical protein JHK82_050531 [Glycine max]
MDLGFQGAPFTWKIGHLLERLDWGLEPILNQSLGLLASSKLLDLGKPITDDEIYGARRRMRVSKFLDQTGSSQSSIVLNRACSYGLDLSIAVQFSREGCNRNRGCYSLCNKVVDMA